MLEQYWGHVYLLEGAACCVIVPHLLSSACTCIIEEAASTGAGGILTNTKNTCREIVPHSTLFSMIL